MMKRATLVSTVAATTLALLAWAPTAQALVPELPFLEHFGSAAQPTFKAEGAPLVFDAANADLLGQRVSENERQLLKIEGGADLGGAYRLSFKGQGTGWEGSATLPTAAQAGSGDLSGAEGLGRVTVGSDEITEVDVSSGAFAVGQLLEVTFAADRLGFPAGTEVLEVSGATVRVSQVAIGGGEAGRPITEDLRRIRAGSKTVANASGAFLAGQAISGAGIQDATTIESVGIGTIVLSKVAVDTASGVALLFGPAEASALSTSKGALVAGERISGPGIQAVTTVVSVNEGEGKLTLSKPVTAAGPATGLSAALPYDASRQTIAAALEKLATVGANNLIVRRLPDDLPVRREIELRNALGSSPQEEIACDGSGLSGAGASCAVTETVEGRGTGIFRYHADGAPAPFSALGRNEIDGRIGPGGKPCAEEPASCDQVPEGQLEVDWYHQMAVDESGAATDGDIYIVQPNTKVVEIFGPDGRYLGQLTKYTEAGKEKTLGEVWGVAVDPSGAVYVGDHTRNRVHKYVPQGAPHDPLTDADNVANFTVSVKGAGGTTIAAAKIGSLAAGAGPSVGFLFVEAAEDAVVKIDSATGAAQYSVFDFELPGNTIAGELAVDSANGHLFTVMRNEGRLREWDASGASEATLLSDTALPNLIGIAVDPASHALYADVAYREPPLVEVYGLPSGGGETHTLTVHVSGEGEVNADSGAISGCSEASGTCEGSYEEGAEVTLTATPDPGSEFTGWSGCDSEPEGKCAVSMDEAREVTATFEEEEVIVEPGLPLTVSVEGTGTGTVTADKGLISCSPFCEDEYPEGTEVTLTASPAEGSQFMAWKHCDKGMVNGRQCTVTMSEAKEVSAVFSTAHSLTVAKAEGSGAGKLQSSPGGIVCLYGCKSATASFLEGKSVTLKAIPAKHFHLLEWGGECSGAGSCEVTMGEDHLVTALFEEDPKLPLTLTKAGAGQGLIKSHPSGVVCGFTCPEVSASFYEGEEVTLEVAKLGKGSSFKGWSGSCSGAGACTVTMSGAKEVTAGFE